MVMTERVDSALSDAQSGLDAGVFVAYSKYDPSLILHKAIYFIIFSAQVYFVPFLPIFLSDSGFSAAGVGATLALRPLALLLATPVFGAIADRGYRRCILVAAIIVSTLIRSFVAWTTSPVLIAVLVIVGEAAAAPISSVLDAAVMGLLERTSSSANYGRTRMFGSIGFGVMAPVAGLVRDSGGPRAAIVVFALLTLAGGVLAWWLPLEGECIYQSTPIRRSRACTKRDPEAATGATVTCVASSPSTSNIDVDSLPAVSGPVEERGILSHVSAERGGLAGMLRPSVLFLLCSVAVMGMLGAFIGNFHFMFLQVNIDKIVSCALNCSSSNYL